MKGIVCLFLGSAAVEETPEGAAGATRHEGAVMAVVKNFWGGRVEPKASRKLV